MSNGKSKVYSLAQVPFSWENSPGVCKVNVKDREESSKDEGDQDQGPKMPPLPCPTESHNIPLPPPCPTDSPNRPLPPCPTESPNIPLPPCPFQPTLRRISRKGLEREDPFLAAYMDCTKKVTKAKFFKGDNYKGSGQRAGKSLSMFSCKYSCEVRDDSNLVRMVHGSSSNPSKDKQLRT